MRFSSIITRTAIAAVAGLALTACGGFQMPEVITDSARVFSGQAAHYAPIHIVGEETGIRVTVPADCEVMAGRDDGTAENKAAIQAAQAKIHQEHPGIVFQKVAWGPLEGAAIGASSAAGIEAINGGGLDAISPGGVLTGAGIGGVAGGVLSYGDAVGTADREINRRVAQTFADMGVEPYCARESGIWERTTTRGGVTTTRNF